MKNLLLTIISAFFFFPGYAEITAYSQQIFNGTVFEDGSNSSIPYAMISVKGKTIGVISDQNGKFSLESDKITSSDSILITSLGFSQKRVAVKDWVNDMAIYIKSNPIQLNEATVTANRTKEEKIGITSGGMKMLFIPLYMKQELEGTEMIGREIGCALDIKHDCIIKKLNFFIAINEYENVKLRALFYDIKDGKPNNIIVNQEIIFEVDQKKDWFTLDLSKYNIHFSKDQQIAVTLMTLDETNRNEFFIYGRMLKQTVLFRRDRALGDWKASKGGMVLYLEAKY